MGRAEILAWNVTMSKDLKGKMEGAMWGSGGRAFQAEGTNGKCKGPEVRV